MFHKVHFGSVIMAKTITDGRINQQRGCCDNINKLGKIFIGINIGNCAWYGNLDGNTGWNSVSRLTKEEIPRSQFNNSLLFNELSIDQSFTQYNDFNKIAYKELTRSTIVHGMGS